MENVEYICPFGPALVKARKEANISQSRLGMKAECNISNLRKIEKGLMQPGVTLALRLVSVCTSDAAGFFNHLAEACCFITWKPDEIGVTELPEEAPIASLMCPAGTASKAVFGKLLKEIRIRNHISQKHIADAAHYHLRNLLNVETAGQEPGIITAMALVNATGFEVGKFFELLDKQLQMLRSIPV